MLYFVYLLECNDGRYYTGLANGSLKSRINEHIKGECRSTAYRLPVKLRWFCAFIKQSKATKFEKYLKSHSGRRFRERFLIIKKVYVA